MKFRKIENKRKRLRRPTRGDIPEGFYEIEGYEPGWYYINRSSEIWSAKAGRMMEPTMLARMKVVYLYKSGRSRSSMAPIKRLMAETFLVKPPGDFVAVTRDKNPDNTDIKNIAWVPKNVGRLWNRKNPSKGVTRHRNKWQAQIYTGESTLYLGVFDTEEQAKAAFYQAFKNNFGKAPW